MYDGYSDSLDMLILFFCSKNVIKMGYALDHDYVELRKKYQCIQIIITSNGGRVVIVVSMSATNWEALVKIGFESWWQCQWCT